MNVERFDGQLELYWNSASEPIGTIIIGGGRWGRVWATVLAKARGSGRNIAMVSRTNPDDVKSWIGRQDFGSDVVLDVGLQGALHKLPNAKVAIIASRPSDHASDCLSAINMGLDVLLEKPISHTIALGSQILSESKAKKRVVMLGTEFAFHPAILQMSTLIDGNADRISTTVLRWDDPFEEMRHGTQKQRHNEVGMLVDLLPHAASIMQLFAPAGSLHIVDANEDTTAGSGFISFSDGTSHRMRFECDVKAERRMRKLEVVRGDELIQLNFGDDVANLSVNGLEVSIAADQHQLSSTLRLEFGAFILNARERNYRQTSFDLEKQLGLQSELMDQLGLPTVSEAYHS